MPVATFVSARPGWATVLLLAAALAGGPAAPAGAETDAGETGGTGAAGDATGAAADAIDPGDREALEPFLGRWWQDDWRGIEISPDGLAMITPDSRFALTPETCPVAFEFEASRRTRGDIAAFYRIDPADPATTAEAASLVDETGAPLDPAVVALLPEGPEPVATLWSYCAAELHGGTLFLEGEAPDRLTAIVTGDGIAALETFHRTPPPPSNENFSDIQREDIQYALSEQGFYGGAIDGIFGPATEAAIRDWQAARGLDATGVLSHGQYLDLVFAD